MNNDIVNDIKKDNKEYEWLKPDRIMKLYRGSKSAFGTKKLFVVGVGGSGWGKVQAGFCWVLLR